jgi:hypothetical protein
MTDRALKLLAGILAIFIHGPWGYAAAPPSSVTFSVTAPLISLATAIDPEIPGSFNENQDPNHDKSTRWDLRSRGPVKINVGANDKITLVKSYYGDFQKFGPLHVSLCHLGDSPGVFEPGKHWVLVSVTISAIPKLASEGGSWYVEATSPDAKVTQDPGSDHKCAFIGLSVETTIDNQLANLNLKQKVASILGQNRLKLQLDQLWARANQPVATTVNLGAFGSALQLCSSSNLTKIDIEPLTSNGANVSVPITLTLNPAIDLRPAAPCPAAAVGPPSIIIH